MDIGTSISVNVGVSVVVCAVCGCDGGCAFGKLFSFEVGCR